MAPAMPFIAAASLAFGIYSSVQASKQQKAAADEAERIGRENAANIEAETQESARRTKKAQDQELATAQARAASSGLEVGGTLSTFLSNLEEGQAESLAWLEKSGANRARLAELSGGYTAATGRAGASATLAAGVSQAGSDAQSLYSAGKGQWWG